MHIYQDDIDRYVLSLDNEWAARKGRVLAPEEITILVSLHGGTA